MPPGVRLRSRALTELLYRGLGSSAVVADAPYGRRAGGNEVVDAQRLRSHASRVRDIAGDHLENAAELVAGGDTVGAEHERVLAERSSFHYMAYDALAEAVGHRVRAGQFERGAPAHEAEVCRAYAAIRRAEGYRERGEAVLCRDGGMAASRHRRFAEEAEEKARIAELRAAEILEGRTGVVRSGL